MKNLSFRGAPSPPFFGSPCRSLLRGASGLPLLVNPPDRRLGGC